jgi:hypothetical protein
MARWEFCVPQWNVREFSICDLDGHVLRIGTDIEADRVPEQLTVYQESEL